MRNKRIARKRRKTIKELVFTTLHRISNTFERWANDWDWLHKNGVLVYEKRNKAEREQRNQRMQGLFGIVFIATIVMILVVLFAKYCFTVYGNDISWSEWNSSSGSFWGAVLGAAFAGIATISTTILVIQRSYKIDYHRERLEVLPVLELRIICKEHINPGKRAKEELKNRVPYENIKATQIYSDVEQRYPSYVFLIKNIGRGIAYRVQPMFCRNDTYGELEYRFLLSTNESLILVSQNRGLAKVAIRFFDLYENEYEQTFYIDERDVLTDPPELVRKTERVRYTQ